MNDNLLLKLIGLPHSLDLAVYQINILCWTGSGDHSETFLLLAHFYQSTPSWLKVRGGNEQSGMLVEQSGMLVAHVILVSAQVLLVLTLGLWTLDLGLTILS